MNNFSINTEVYYFIFLKRGTFCTKSFTRTLKKYNCPHHILIANWVFQEFPISIFNPLSSESVN